jgi:hypothetical protein
MQIIVMGRFEEMCFIVTWKEELGEDPVLGP